MRWTIVPMLSLVFLARVLAADELPRQPASAAPQRVVIPFDFESKFDDGRYGQMIGDMVWKKLQTQGGFIIPETMQDVRDWSQRTGIVPGPDTPLDKMKDIVRKEQAADIAIWGKVERVPGNETDVYDLWILIADFTTDPIKIIYEKKARTKTVSEIPHVYVKEALDKLFGRTPEVAKGPDPAMEERWQKAPNLVKGDFEEGRNGPLGWDPLPRYVTWVNEEGVKPKNHIIRFTLNEDVAGGTGVLYYSDFFPVEEGATYRFQCRWRTTGSAAKVFIKCYDEIPTKYRDKTVTSSGIQRREVYRSQENLKGGAGAWNTHTEDFTPTHTQYNPRWGRVMLYAYWPTGTVEWDDVVVKQIAPPPEQKGEKDKRPSLETKVGNKDINDP